MSINQSREKRNKLKLETCIRVITKSLVMIASFAELLLHVTNAANQSEYYEKRYKLKELVRHKIRNNPIKSFLGYVS